MKICPTNALSARRDGIVDLNSASCIAAKLHGRVPYDQCSSIENTRTAEKCNSARSDSKTN